MDQEMLNRLMTTVNVRSPLDLMLKMRDRKVSRQLAAKDQDTLFSILMKNASAPIHRADSLLERKMERCCLLKSSSSTFNEILDGGLYTSEILEICGPSATGKSLLCRSLCLNVARDQSAAVIYIDTKFQFDVNLFANNDANLGYLNHIVVESVSDIFQLFHIIHTFDDIVKRLDPFPVRLLVIDAVTQLFTPYFGADSPAECLGLMNTLAVELRRLADEYELGVVICNQSVRYDGTQLKAALGAYWSSVPHVRLMLHNKKSSLVECTVLHANRLEVGQNVSINHSDIVKLPNC